jgi:hypothetical protein
VKNMKQRTVQKEKRLPVNIDGLEDFDLSVVGLTPDSIERSGGHIVVPVELIPFLKICKMPKVTRRKVAETKQRYVMRLKAGKVKPRKNVKKPCKRKKSRKKRS